MKHTKRFPSIPEDLLKSLEEVYPDKLPDDTSITLNEVNVLQGQQQVIRFLRTQFERQNKTILEKE